jgi:NAD(P)-dependent dehydrogenase (short-subunit alcohol dehydrogenase family)
MPSNGSLLRSVVITGASSGIGHALARRLDAEGWRVFAGVRNATDAERLRSELSARSEPVLLDVTDAAHIAAAKTLVETRTGGRVNAVVNNAGIVFHAPVESLTVEGVREQFEVNVVGVFAVTQAFLPLLRATHGRVVIVGSISGRVAWPFNGVYAASKHAVRAMVESLRLEQRSFGVRVSLVEPGAFATSIWQKKTPARFLANANLEAPVRKRYEAAQRIVERAMDVIGARAPQPDRCVAAIRHALTARSPRACYTVGNDIWLQLVFASLPASFKDPLISFGMNRVLKRPDGASRPAIAGTGARPDVAARAAGSDPRAH